MRGPSVSRDAADPAIGRAEVMHSVEIQELPPARKRGVRADSHAEGPLTRAPDSCMIMKMSEVKELFAWSRSILIRRI